MLLHSSSITAKEGGRKHFEIKEIRKVECKKVNAEYKYQLKYKKRQKEKYQQNPEVNAFRRLIN